MTRYMIVIEGDGTSNYSAFCPDIDGVIATGDTVEECRTMMGDALAVHIAVLREEGEAVPPPKAVGAGWLAVLDGDDLPSVVTDTPARTAWVDVPDA